MFGKPSSSTRRRLEAHGVAAKATVLAISDRGMAVSHNGGTLVGDTEVVLKTTLRVQPDGDPAFEVRRKFRYPQLAIPSPGSELTVRFDPDDHGRIMIDHDALPIAFGGMDVGGLKDLLAAVQGAQRRDAQGPPVN